MLLNDLVSCQAFLQADIPKLLSQLELVEKLRSLSLKKLMIVGQSDRLISSLAIQRDSELTHSKFIEVPNASHFVTFDQPEAVARLIEEAFCDERGNLHEKCS
jgi:pimeloyl-ACP methyl ester carboxylesterase